MMKRKKKLPSKPDSPATIFLQTLPPDTPYQVYLRKLKAIFLQKESLRPANWKEQIAALNTMTVGKAPALLTYFIGKISGQIPGPVDQSEIAFWNFLLSNGIDRYLVCIARENLMILIIHQKNIHALRWYLEDCHFQITACEGSGNPVKPGTPTHPLLHIEFLINSEFNTYFFNQFDACTPLHDTAIILSIRLAQMPLLVWLIRFKEQSIHVTNDNGVTPLMEAVKTNLEPAIEYLMTLNANISSKTTAGLTALHYAIWNENEPILIKLIEGLQKQGKCVSDILDNEGFSLLHWAIKYNKLTLLDFLESLFKIDEAFLDPDGNNLAVFACAINRPEIAERLMHQYQLSIYGKNKVGMTALFLSIVDSKNSVKSIEWLITKHSFTLSDLNILGDTPLIFAARVDNQCAIQFILQKLTGPLHRVNSEGNHVGHYLAENNQSDVIQSLLKQDKLDLMRFNADGLTMLDIALIKDASYYKTVQVCIEYAQSYHRKKQVKPLTSFRKIPSFPSLLRFFCEDHLIKLDPWVEDGQPPLHMACISLPQSHIEDLINHFKLDVNQVNQHGQTVVAYMITQGLKRPTFLKKARWFIEAFQPRLNNLDSLGSSLLHLACEQQDLELVQYCIEKQGLSLFKTRRDHLTALDIVLIRQHLHLVIYLWGRLSVAEQKSYVAQLNSNKEQQCINYLTMNHLYEPEVCEKLEEIKPLDICITKEEASNTPIEREPTVCDRVLFLNAIEEHRVDYIKSLKHHDEFSEILASCAHEALLLAIKPGNHSMVYHLLRIPSIQKRAHENDNAALAKACELGLYPMVESLLRIPLIQSNISNNNHAAYRWAGDHQNQAILSLLLRYPEVQTYANHIEAHMLRPAPQWAVSYPKCCEDNPTLKSRLHQLSDLVNSSPCQHAYIYGSFHFKTPNDLDILLPNITSIEAKNAALALIYVLLEDSGIVTTINKHTREYGYKKHSLHIIPMEWRGIKIEWVLTEKDYQTHALALDFTIGAQYFNLKTLALHEIPGLHSRQDVQNKTINTISEPQQSFREDLSRIFRAIRLMADEGFYLSETCEGAIKGLFSSDFNPFIQGINPDKLNQQLTLLFKSPNPSKHIQILHELDVLNKLFHCISMNVGQAARYYTEQLRPYYQYHYPEEELAVNNFPASLIVSPPGIASQNPFLFYSQRMSGSSINHQNQSLGFASLHQG